MKSLKTAVVEFNENLDEIFENKKLEINNRILQLRYEKERASQQNQKNPGTNAYNPITPIQMHNSDDDGGKSRSNHSSDQDLESDSDISSDSDVSAANMNLKNELNHAQCIKDLSFYK